MLSFFFLNLFSAISSNSLIDSTYYHQIFYPENNTYYYGSNITNYQLFNSDNLEECQNNCTNNQYCLGLYVKEEPEYVCYGIDYFGPELETNISSSTYIKHTHYQNYQNNSLHGWIIGSNRSIYIDLNHNGILDNNDIVANVSANDDFAFHNLDSGNYINS